MDNAGLLVTFGNGDGTYQPPIRTVLAEVADAFTLTDVDGDGRYDVITYSGTDPIVRESLSVLLGSPDGTFRFVTKIPIFGSVGTFGTRTFAGANPIAVADFDHNGLPDIVVLEDEFITFSSPVDIVNVRLNQGNGFFANPVAYPTGTASPGQFSQSLVVTGDFNGDGNPDIAVASPLGKIAILLGNGAGAFSTPLSFTALLDPGTQITSLTASDLNGDGRSDLVTAQSWLGVPTTASISVYLGNGDGTVATGVVYRPSVLDLPPTVLNPAGIIIIDLTGDGKPDIVTSIYRSSGLGDIVIFPGNGDGTFQPSAIYQVSGQPYQLAAADLNSDGRVDLLITSPHVSAGLVSAFVLEGHAAPFLRLHITHDPATYMDQTAIFMVQVVNLGDDFTNGVVTLDPSGGLEGTLNSAVGWTCAFIPFKSTLCTRSEPLAPGASYPAFPANFGKPSPQVPQDNPAIVATVSGAGSMRSNARDAASVVRLNANCPFLLQDVPKRTVIGRNGGSLNWSPGGDPFCPWTGQSDQPWVTVPTSPDNFTITVDPNPTTATRIANLSFSSPTGWSASFTIEQSGQACLYNLLPASWTADYHGAPYEFFVKVEDGCPWTAATTADWLTVTSYPLGFEADAAANNTGKSRSATIAVGNVVATVYQGTTEYPAGNGSIAHLAVGAGWDSTIQLVNASPNVGRTWLTTLDDAGAYLTLPVFIPGDDLYTETYFSLNQILTAHASRSMVSAEPGTAVTIVGSAQIKFDPGVGGFVRFNYAPRGQEAIVPLETRNAQVYSFGFDNTNGIDTGVAIASLVSIPNSATINVVIRDDNGVLIVNSQFQLYAGSHDSFVLSARYPESAARSGTIEFSTPAAGQISVLGIRFPPGARFTTIPVAANSDPGSGVMSHLAVGDGWSTTVEVLNTTASPAPVSLKFFSPDGTPLTLSMSVAGAAQTAAKVERTLAPHSRMMIDVTGLAAAPLQLGSAQLTSGSGVSGFIRFRYAPRAQEAIVPLNIPRAATYVLAFDSTNGIATGVALANSASTIANIPATIYDESGTPLGSATVTLPANGQTSFVLTDRFAATANRRGTIEFTTPASGSIGVLGFRFPPSGAFTTIPVISPN